MIYGDALKLIGGLSHPSKMPWWAWSISANDCITGGKLAQVEGTICNSCYALKGNYRFSNVVAAHERRKQVIGHPDFVEAFVVVLSNLHAKTRKTKMNGEVENRFRWMDSGDIQSVEMLRNINEVARRTPQIDHWLPTRELQMVKEFLRGDTFAPNLIVRISTAKVGDRPTKQPLGLPYASVDAAPTENLHVCPAREHQGNRCLDCDRCWTTANVDYPLH